MTDMVELRRRAEQTLGACCLPGPEMVALLDEIEWLRKQGAHLADALEAGRAEIERLTAEVAEWKERWAAERHDHEATMKAWDEERSGL